MFKHCFKRWLITHFSYVVNQWQNENITSHCTKTNSKGWRRVRGRPGKRRKTRSAVRTCAHWVHSIANKTLHPNETFCVGLRFHFNIFYWNEILFVIKLNVLQVLVMSRNTSNRWLLGYRLKTTVASLYKVNLSTPTIIRTCFSVCTNHGENSLGEGQWILWIDIVVNGKPDSCYSLAL